MGYSIKSKIIDIFLVNSVGALSFFLLLIFFKNIIPQVQQYWKVAFFIVVAFALKENIEILKTKEL